MSDIRVFVSIPIPDKSPLAGPSRDLRGIGNVRPSPLDQTHITLRFIGDVDESRVDEIAGCVSKAVEGVGPFRVTLSGVGAFPDRRRPSVVWVGASPQDVMSGIADRLGDNLKRAGIGFDGKPFRSHVTIGRCRGPVNLDGFFRRYEGREFLSFDCTRVLVMRSVLGPGGAEHTVLRGIDLRGSSGNAPPETVQRFGPGPAAAA